MFFSFGGRGGISLLLLVLLISDGVALNEESFGGLASVVNEEEQTLLRIILADGSNGELVSKGEKSMVGKGAGGSLRGCFRIWRGKDAVRTIAAWRGLVNFWAFLRKVLKVKS